jgi:hypothetical protein
MQHLNIQLWRNEQKHNWSVTINGETYEFIPMESVKELVLRAVALAEGSMTDPMNGQKQ